MSRIKFEPNRAGIRELLKSQEVAEECRQHAERTLEGVSGVEGYSMGQRNYPERTGYAVYAEEYPAIADNLKNNSLLKALK